MKNYIYSTLHLFKVDGEIIFFAPLGNGHINSTYICETDTKHKYVLQKINNNVFKDVKLLMNNYYEVTRFLLDNGFESIELIKTIDNNIYTENFETPYRLYKYIDYTVCFEKIDDLKIIYKCAQSYGIFHKALKKFDASKLGEVIPNFHNTKQRYLNLLDAINLDKCNRKQDCLPEIETIKSFEKEFDKIVSLLGSKELPLEVVHNDPKINNVLFDDETKDFRAIIDLDTIMPGSYLYDFGDALRSLFTGDNEDNEDLSLLKVNYEIFDAYAKGYLSVMKKVLTKKEKELLAFSSFLLTIECGMRFLEDYLRGDVYFKTVKEKHNLVRARTQITLACDIYKNLNKLDEIANKYF